MKHFQKGFGLPVLLIILGLVVVAGGAFWYVQNTHPVAPMNFALQTATSTGQAAQPTPTTINTSVSTKPNNDVPTATIDQAILTTNSLTPTLTGTATNISEVGVFIAQKTATYTGWQSVYGKNVSVINGQWSLSVPSTASLSSGTYQVSVQRGNTVLTSGSLIVNNMLGWQTFTNTRDGYSVKYPQDAGTPSIDSPSQLKSYGFETSLTFLRLGGWADVYSFNGSLQDAIAENAKIDSTHRVYQSTTNAVIGGRSGKIVSWTNNLASTPVIQNAYFVEYQPGKTLLIMGTSEFVSTLTFL